MDSSKYAVFSLKSTMKLVLMLIVLQISTAQAAKTYSPSHVFAAVDYANRLMDRILNIKKITGLQLPRSKETAAKPMHVYELHVSTLNELHRYAVQHNRNPPPLAVSTPIKYTATDVYYLTQLIIQNLRDLYEDEGGVIDFTLNSYQNKSPSDVYQRLFELYYKVNRLNGKNKISPSVVYSHTYRAVEDLKYSLLTVSNQLDKQQQNKKRLLVTSTYGMHPNGSNMAPTEVGKTPADVIDQAFIIRSKLNILRKHNKLIEIRIPDKGEYGKIKPIDVFLQTQFIIAEINLLKIPMSISSSTNRAKPVTGKSPSDVYQQMKHINYMLDRLIRMISHK